MSVVHNDYIHVGSSYIYITHLSSLYISFPSPLSASREGIYLDVPLKHQVLIGGAFEKQLNHGSTVAICDIGRWAGSEETGPGVTIW